MRNMMLLWGIAVLLATPTTGRCQALAELLTGKTYPLIVQVKTMTQGWSQFTLTGQEGVENFVQSMMQMRGMPNPPNLFYTQGKTLTLGEETFLVAYRQEAKPIDIRQLVEGDEIPDLSTPLTPETMLVLSLLNLRMLRTMQDITPFDLKRELAADAERQAALEEERKKFAHAKVVSQLRQLATAVAMYTQDNDGLFPPMKTPDEFKEAVIPYLGGADEIFINPLTKEPFVPNAVLSGKKLAEVANPAAMVVIYEKTPGPAGQRGIGFADGHAKFVNEHEWEKYRKQSGIN